MDEKAETKPVHEIQLELARTQTSMALDRTLLAWVRTSLSLIGFGFTLAKFVHDLILTGYLRGVDPESPRILGYGMMTLGILGLLGATVEHVASVKRIRAPLGISVWSSALVLTLILAGIGLLLILGLLKDPGAPNPAMLPK
jgi:putative membrane protein